eukprot:4132225-Pyramimonas_sp.AAC.2
MTEEEQGVEKVKPAQKPTMELLRAIEAEHLGVLARCKIIEKRKELQEQMALEQEREEEQKKMMQQKVKLTNRLPAYFVAVREQVRSQEGHLHWWEGRWHKKVVDAKRVDRKKVIDGRKVVGSKRVRAQASPPTRSGCDRKYLACVVSRVVARWGLRGFHLCTAASGDIRARRFRRPAAHARRRALGLDTGK